MRTNRTSRTSRTVDHNTFNVNLSASPGSTGGGGSTPPPPSGPNLDFSTATNSQYINVIVNP